MKKLFISLSLALGLLASTTAQAQTTQTPFVFPASAYQVQTQAGTFTDISTAEGVVAIGADLPAKTELKDMMIMLKKLKGNMPSGKDTIILTPDPDSPSPALIVNNNNYLADNPYNREYGFPIGFDFKLSGKTMKYFVISAFGGVFFDEDTIHKPFQSGIGTQGENCVIVHPYVAKTKNGNPTMVAAGPTARYVTNKSGQPIAYYLTSGTPGQRVLTVQHHYLVTGDTTLAETDRDEWIFQFKFHEGTNNIDFVVKQLPANQAINTSASKNPKSHRMSFGFSEFGSSIPKTYYDPLGSSNMNITTDPLNINHRFFLGQSDAVFTAKGWDSVIIASAMNSNQLIIKDNGPTTGHTISLIYPDEGSTPIAKFKPEDFIISDENLNGTLYSAKIQLDTNLFKNYSETFKTPTIVAVLSKDETPRYTFESGTFYGQNHKFEDGSVVLLNTCPKYTKVSNPAEGYRDFKLDPKKALTISASDLSTSTTYYIHLYRMEYMHANAPLYSELCHTLSFTTAMDAPKSLTAGLPTLNSVDLTVTPDGNSEVIIIKANTLKNFPQLSGNLAKGDSITSGDIKAVVVDIVNKGTYTVPLTDDEGCYFAAFSVNRANAEAYTYSENYLSVSVRAAYNGLPGLTDFSTFDYQIPADLLSPGFEQIHKTTFRDLPFGWAREIQVPTTSNGNAFGIGKPGYDKELPVYLFAIASSRWLDVVTPAFVCDKNTVLVTYNVDLFKTGDDGISHEKPVAKDSIRIEYAIEDGAWITGALYTGASMPDLTPEGLYPLEFTIKDEDINGKRIRIRYSYYSAQDRHFNVIASTDIVEGKTCDRPVTIRTVDSLMTDKAIALSWIDNNYPAAETFTVFYKEESDESDNWQSLNTKSTTAVIPELENLNVYTVAVAANCGKDGSSFNSYPVSLTTLYAFPLNDDLGREPDYIDDNGFQRKGNGPFNRGFTTATGTLSGRKDIVLSISPEAGAVKAGSEIMLYATTGATTGVSIAYNLYKQGETVPTTFDNNNANKQTVEASSVKITIDEETTVHAVASVVVGGKTVKSTTLKAKFTIDENAPDQTPVMTPAILTPAVVLTEVTSASGSAFSSDASYPVVVDNKTATSVGVREPLKNAWLITPSVYIEKYGMNYPLNIQFKANSAQQIENADGTKEWVKGNIPEKYVGAQLHVLVSNNGQFTIDDTVATIPIAGNTLKDTAFSLDIPGLEGPTQVAFYYVNPKANPNAENDPMMLFEIYDFAFGYVGTPCFPLTDLKRSNTTTDQATFSWKGNSAEYMIYWGLNSAETYTDSAKTTETSYTVTGLKDYTQYKVKIVGYCDAEHTETTPNELTASFMTFQECHTPLNFEITDVTATGATFISATDQPDFLSKRLIYVTPEQGGETQILEQLNDTLAVTEKFAELTAYVATTQAICGTDSSEISEPKSFTTIAKPVKDSFNVVLNVTPENAGTVTGAGRYEEGEEVTIAATAAANYTFVAWMNANDTLSKEASYTFSMPAESLTYTALFVEKQANEEILRAAFNVMTQNGQLHIRNLKGLTIEEVIVYGLTGRKINHFKPNSREDLVLPVDAENALLLVRVATEQGVTVYKVYLH